MPVYCGNLLSHNVRASSGKRSKKAHSRSRCRKVSGKAQADARCVRSGKRCVVRASAVKRFNPAKYVAPVRRSKKQAGGASECAKKSEADCVAPCVFRKGAKRSFCTDLGKRGPSNKSSPMVDIPVPPPMPQFRAIAPPAGYAMSRHGSLCNAMPEADCKKNSGKKNFPCRWVNATDKRKAYCGIATKAATMGEDYRMKKQSGGRQQRRSRQQQQFW